MKNAMLSVVMMSVVAPAGYVTVILAFSFLSILAWKSKKKFITKFYEIVSRTFTRTYSLIKFCE